jgi:hypothetical protein
MGWQTTRRLPTHRCRCYIEPCVLGDDEIPVSNIEYGQHGNDQTQNDVQLSNTDNIVNNNDEDGVFEIEKILRKTYINGKWLCIVKWQDFDAKYNSLVQFSDLNKESQEYVTDMHDIIFTERKS